MCAVLGMDSSSSSEDGEALARMRAAEAARAQAAAAAAAAEADRVPQRTPLGVQVRSCEKRWATFANPKLQVFCFEGAATGAPVVKGQMLQNGHYEPTSDLMQGP